MSNPTLAQIAAVVEFAKANGFPNAEMALWDDADDGESPGHLSIEEAMEDYEEKDGVRSFVPGVYLHGWIQLKRVGPYDDDKIEEVIECATTSANQQNGGE